METHLAAAMPPAAESDSAPVHRREDLGSSCGEPVWSSFSNPCLDLFIADRATRPQHLIRLLSAAWKHDPLTTLKLICNRAKDDLESFYTAVLWLHKYHPRTLSSNVPVLVKFGYVKALPEILYRLVLDFAKEKAKVEGFAPDSIGLAGLKRARSEDHPADAEPSGFIPDSIGPAGLKRPRTEEGTAGGELSKKAEPLAPSELEEELNKVPNVEDGELSQKAELEEEGSEVERLIMEELNKVSNVEASKVVGSDMELIRVDLDIMTESAEPMETDVEPVNQRKIADVVNLGEPARCKYNEDANYSVLFDAIKRAEESISKVVEPEIGASAPVLHQLVEMTMAKAPRRNMRTEQDKEIRKEKIQYWNSIMSDLRSKKSLTNCLAVLGKFLDESADKKLLKVSLGLSLMISQLSVAPWTNVVLGFNETSVSPRFLDEKLSLGAFGKKLKQINKLADSSGRFSLKKIYEWILHWARAMEVSPTEMVKTIFIFADRDFEHASVQTLMGSPTREDMIAGNERPWRDEYIVLREKFRSHGYQDVFPQVVFWNLKGARSAGLTCSEDGMMKISGYSDEFLELFMSQGGVIEQEDEMYSMISAVEHRDLKVVD